MVLAVVADPDLQSAHANAVELVGSTPRSVWIRWFVCEGFRRRISLKGAQMTCSARSLATAIAWDGRGTREMAAQAAALAEQQILLSAFLRDSAAPPNLVLFFSISFTMLIY